MAHTLTINDQTLPVIIRKHPTARRMILRYQPRGHFVTVTIPRYSSYKQALHFARQQVGWIARQITQTPPYIPFADGQVIPLFGRDYTLRHVGGRGVVRMEDACIYVTGEEAFMDRRVRDFLKKLARREIERLVLAKAEQLGVQVKKIRMRDTRSMWGSCTQDGDVSFSWRLIFAPYAVLDYVVSHEVAHRLHLDHSAAFWALAERLHPGCEQPKDWLKAHGHRLHYYGAASGGSAE